MNFRPCALIAASVALVAASLGFPLDASAQAPERGGIVFTGSSIFQFWTHLTDQMAPLPVLNHAIAGTVTQDMIDRIGQLVLPYQPRIVVYYCGSNDISSGEDAGPIVDRTKRFIQILHDKSPNTFFYYTAIQKAPEKRARWDVVEAVNREMERYSRQTPNVGYIDLNPVLFDSHNNVRENLFLSDGLHFRPDSTSVRTPRPIGSFLKSSNRFSPKPGIAASACLNRSNRGISESRSQNAGVNSLMLCIVTTR